MITRAALPPTFTAYEKLTVCSNELIGGGHIIALGEMLPLLVGCGESPMVWLQAPTDKTGKNFVPLVVASVASHPAVSVVSSVDGLSISVGGTPVLHVVQTSSTTAVIDFLDLRPVGLNISGNATALIAGGATLSRNTFSGGSTLIVFDSVS